MKPELQAKFLQHLNRKQSDKGFTLIELLVVIIIIGILAAIALPTFLNQTAKGKQSEAKNTVSAVNKAQVAYRTENQSFASDMTTLALGLPTSTTNYGYGITAGTDSATILATAKDTGLKGYTGGAFRYVNTNNETAIATGLCEALSPGIGAQTAPTLSTNTVSCGANYKQL
ncbi:MAG TPA: type IV pilin-like G/H family protein [Oculatellaceae cyanobacterium]